MCDMPTFTLFCRHNVSIIMVKDFFNKVFRKGVQMSALIPMQNYSMEWGAEQYLKAYEVSPYVYACVRKRAEKVGEIEFKLSRLTATDRADITSHPLLDVLYRPNPFQTKNEFFELLQIYRDLTGSAYIYVIRTGEGQTAKINELHLLRPDWIHKVNISKETGLPVSFMYRPTGSGEGIELPASDVIPFHYPHPMKQWGGLSPIKAGRLPIDTAQQLSMYHNRILKNGGKIEGILSYKQSLTEEQVRSIQKQFAEYYEGAENSGKPLVTYGDSDYKNLGLTPTELSYIESLKVTRNDILLIYGVPKAIVAQTDDVNFANAKTAKEIFLSETIRPLIRSLVTKLDEFLIPEPFELSFVDPTPDDVELKLKQIESGAKNYYLTINEQRALAGFEPMDNGDQILVPFGLVGLGSDSADPTIQNSVKKSFNHPLSNADFRKQYHADWIKRADKSEMMFRKLIKSYFKKQGERVTSYLDSTPKSYFTKAGLKKNVIEDVFHLNNEINLAKEAALPVILDIFRKEGQKIYDMFNKEHEFRVTPSNYTLLDKRAELFANEINDTTFKKLQDTFADSVANGESRQDLVKRIQSVYDNFDEGRANTIARTEVAVSSQSGIMDAYTELNVPIKIWVAVQDSATRESHAAIDGEEQLMNAPFSNGLMYPADPNGDASEVVNCRCSI